MKKLLLVPALALGFVFSVTAQQADEAETAVVTSATQDFVEIAVDNLPQAVKDAAAKDYAEHTISKAYATADALTFKLELADKAGETSTVYCDAEGNWIKQEEEK
ncbi:hypothetical protein ABN763_07160 [Spongiivirga sp. MCCC 1A20706]|uniref:hypothetical protein n=1 Tax=Spongiivirga sp. MCCC 1A20706 TaxID=3160963 RepID=UPI003977290C